MQPRHFFRYAVFLILAVAAPLFPFSAADAALLERLEAAGSAEARRAVFTALPAPPGDDWYTGACAYLDGLAAAGQATRALQLCEYVAELAAWAGKPVMRGWAGFTRGRIAYYHAYDTPRARQAFQEAVEIFRMAGEKFGLANSLNALAETDVAFGDFRGATGHYEQALNLYRELRVPLGEANCLKGLGDVAAAGNQYRQAAPLFEEALQVYQRLGNPLGEANALKSLADMHFFTGKTALARRMGEAAYALYRELRLPAGEAACLKLFADIAYHASDYREAEDRYNEAIALYEKTGITIGAVDCRYGLALIANQLSDLATAESLYEAGLAASRQARSPIRIANHLKGLADIRLSIGEYAEAADRYREALSAYRESGSPLGEANCLKNLGDCLLALGDKADAEGQYANALTVYQKIGDRLGIANCRRSLGEIALEEGRSRQAALTLAEAAGLYRALGDRRSQTRAEAGLARALLASGQVAAAIEAITRAVDALGAARGMAGRESAQTITQEHYAAFLKPAILTSALHDPRFSLEALESFRGRTFLDRLKGNAALEAAGLPPALRGEFNTLQEALHEARVLLHDSFQNKDEASWQQATAAIAAHERNLDRLEKRVAATNERYRMLLGVNKPRVAELAAALDGDEAAIVYIVANEACGAWILHRDREAAFVYLPVPAGELAISVSNYSKALLAAAADSGEAVRRRTLMLGRRLAEQVLVQPLSGISGRIRKLVIVPDGILGHVPWETITVGGRRLGETRTVSYAPSLAVLALLRGRAAAGGFTYPVFAFGGARYAGQGTASPLERGRHGFRDDDLEDLPGTTLESETVVAVHLRDRPAGARASMLFRGLWVSEEAIKSLAAGITNLPGATGRRVRLGDARILHFATHGVADPLIPESSRLVLSRHAALSAAERETLVRLFPERRREDGSLTAAETVGLAVRAEVVVLSACETGAGQVTATEGIVGLTQAWMVAGASGVVVSLWPVSDVGTRVLMSLFHRALADGMAPREALAFAQRQLADPARPWAVGEFAPHLSWESGGVVSRFRDLDLTPGWYWGAFQYWGR